MTFEPERIGKEKLLILSSYIIEDHCQAFVIIGFFRVRLHPPPPVFVRNGVEKEDCHGEAHGAKPGSTSLLQSVPLRTTPWQA
jgi:hypothetical protein